MIRLALAFSLLATPASACLTRPVTDLLTSRIVQNLTASGDWEVSEEAGGINGFCYDCADERGFSLFVMPHEQTSVERAIAEMDRGREAFCAQIATDGSGRCISSEDHDLFDLPGRRRQMELGGLTFVSEEFACGQMVFHARAYATRPTEGLSDLSQSLRPMLRYLTPFW